MARLKHPSPDAPRRARVALIRDGRDLRVDFFRGIALWWIFTDHIPGSLFGNLSIRNYALCDATEIFVLLAGYAAGLAYGGTMRRHGWALAAADVVKRAWTLYIAHIFLFVIFAAQVGFSAATLDRADYLDEIHLDAIGPDPYRALLEALTLHFQPAYLNVLPLYVVILLLFAVLMPLLRLPGAMAAVSLGIYAIARNLDLNLPSWTGGGWFFNPFCWQILLMFGAILSFAPQVIPAPVAPHSRNPSGRKWRILLDLLAAAMIGFGIAMQFIVWPHPHTVDALPPALYAWLMAVDKEGLHPLRALSIAAIAWAAARLVRVDAKWLRSRLAAPFVLAGQHSLPVFCASIFLSFLGRLATEWNDSFAIDAAVNFAGTLAMVVVAAIAAWYGNKTRYLPRSITSDT